MSGWVLIYVEMADYREAVVHGPYATREEAERVRAERFNSFTEEEMHDDIWEGEDESDVVMLKPLLGSG